MGTFESMINEMVRWNATPAVKERTPAAEAPETVLEDEDDDDDELDSEDGISAWPSSGGSNSVNQKKAGTHAP